MTRNEMMRRMSSSEFSEWIAMYNIDPWGEEREDLRAGMIAAPIVNCWSKKKRKPTDWILFQEKHQQTMEEMKQILIGLASKGKK